MYTPVPISMHAPVSVSSISVGVQYVAGAVGSWAWRLGLLLGLVVRFGRQGSGSGVQWKVPLIFGSFAPTWSWEL